MLFNGTFGTQREKSQTPRIGFAQPATQPPTNPTTQTPLESKHVPVDTTVSTTTTTAAAAATGVNATPAPTSTALDTEARGFESLGFEDKPLTLAGGEAIALGALGLFAVLTFLPFCTK